MCNIDFKTFALFRRLRRVQLSFPRASFNRSSVSTSPATALGHPAPITPSRRRGTVCTRVIAYIAKIRSLERAPPGLAAVSPPRRSAGIYTVSQSAAPRTARNPFRPSESVAATRHFVRVRLICVCAVFNLFPIVFAERDDWRVGVTAVGRRWRGRRLVARRHGRRRLRHVLYRGRRGGRPRRFRVRRGRVLVSAGRGRRVAAALRQPPQHAGHHGRVRAVSVHRPEPVPEHRHVVVLPALGKSSRHRVSPLRESDRARTPRTSDDRSRTMSAWAEESACFVRSDVVLKKRIFKNFFFLFVRRTTACTYKYSRFECRTRCGQT